MLLSISVLIVVLFTIYYGTKVYLNKQHVSPMTGKSITMAMGMVSSLMVGLFSAIPLQGQLAVSTVLAILISMLIAYFIGRPFGSLAVVEALAASLMGSMMGAMLGEMLPANHTALFIISMDVIYLFSVSSIMRLIYKETVDVNHTESKPNMMSHDHHHMVKE
ncbi:hypothetical protein [Aneurinibacillus tyrosinisolvens]|uniref:hypothetical protein n=1 Tax=Aneurinibacillus tyrosinisolvens TaxID=1443435 RepID=UPI00063F1705|nr:hypothetical protein [Aneurinibacillus tyrosinisolvens]